MPKNFGREPICCAVCLRQATGLGYAPKMGAPVAWACEDLTCIRNVKAVYHMSGTQLNHHEARALVAAGDKAGAYLESIGQTDLGSLTETEWLTFLRTILEGYSSDMRERITSHAAPF